MLGRLWNIDQLIDIHLSHMFWLFGLNYKEQCCRFAFWQLLVQMSCEIFYSNKQKAATCESAMPEFLYNSVTAMEPCSSFNVHTPLGGHLLERFLVSLVWLVLLGKLFTTLFGNVQLPYVVVFNRKLTNQLFNVRDADIKLNKLIHKR